MTTTNSIVIVGAGPMGSAIALGLTQSRTDLSVIIVESDPRRRDDMNGAGVPTIELLPNPITAEVIILSIPPQALPTFSNRNPHLNAYTGIIVSVMAGISISELTNQFKSSKICRAIPNLPCAINAGMTVLKFAPKTTKKHSKLVTGVFSKLGKSLLVDDEQLIDSATALVGGGPAYVSYFASALIEYATLSGFDIATATSMTNQVFLGTSALLEIKSESPTKLCERVMTPGGTTQQAINFFNQMNVRSILIEGLNYSCAGSRELGRRS